MIILCMMRIPPDLNGHGGSQRAWRLVEALRALGDVHFVLIGRQADKDVAAVSLAPLAGLVGSITTIDIAQWQPTARAAMPHPRLSTGWADLIRMRSHEAPAFSDKTLASIASRLPVREVDLAFAGRLPCAMVVQDLMDRGMLRARARFADFDDIMSNFRTRQREFLGIQDRLLARVDIALIRRAERRIALGWETISVCTSADAGLLAAAYPAAHPIRVPNVINRPLLPMRTPDGVTRLLFVGNLSFYPNVQGLRLFLEVAWATIRAACAVRLDVVGLHPGAEMAAMAEQFGFALHGDVASVAPYYAASDIVISPILVGSGTRIKILEAMAYGRPVVATEMAAEGLGLTPGRHFVRADTMAGFADGVIGLAADAARRADIAGDARALVVAEYGVEALHRAVADGIPPGVLAEAPALAG